MRTDRECADLYFRITGKRHAKLEAALTTFGPEIARLAKHERAAVILAKVTGVQNKKRLFGSIRQTLHLDVKRVLHVGKDVVHLEVSPGYYRAYNDGGWTFHRTFEAKPFPRDSIKRGETYWLVVTTFMSSGIWVVARERVRPK